MTTTAIAGVGGNFSAPDTRIALTAAGLYRQYKLATADAVVYVTALEYGADVLTCDTHFEKLPSVLFLRKSEK